MTISTEIIRENQTIVLEDLKVSEMVKNRKLSRAISETRLDNIQNIFRMNANIKLIEYWLHGRWLVQ